jgi:hypothetical protein
MAVLLELPAELLRLIIGALRDAPSLCRCECTCRTLCDLVRARAGDADLWTNQLRFDFPLFSDALDATPDDDAEGGLAESRLAEASAAATGLPAASAAAATDEMRITPSHAGGGMGSVEVLSERPSSAETRVSARASIERRSAQLYREIFEGRRGFKAQVINPRLRVVRAPSLPSRSSAPRAAPTSRAAAAVAHRHRPRARAAVRALRCEDMTLSEGVAQCLHGTPCGLVSLCFVRFSR